MQQSNSLLNYNNLQTKEHNRRQKLKVSFLSNSNQQNAKLQKPLPPSQYIHCSKTDGVYKCYICQNLKKKQCPFGANLSNSRICKHVNNQKANQKIEINSAMFDHHENQKPALINQSSVIVRVPPMHYSQYMIQQHVMYPFYHNIYYQPSEDRKRGTSSNPQTKRKSIYNSSAKKRRFEQSTLLLSQPGNQPLPPKQLRKLAETLLFDRK